MTTPNYNFTELDPNGKIDIANDVNTALDEIDSTIKTLSDDLTGDIDGKAPTNHASTAATYGLGTSAYFGHVKTVDNGTQTASQSYAASPKMVSDSIGSVKNEIKSKPLPSTQANMMPYGSLLSDKLQSICSDGVQNLYAFGTPDDTQAYCIQLNSSTNTMSRKTMPSIFSHPNDATFISNTEILVCDRTTVGSSDSYSIYTYNYTTNTGSRTGFTQQNIYCTAYDSDNDVLYGIIGYPNQATGCKVVVIDRTDWTIEKENDIAFNSTIGIQCLEYHNGYLYLTLHSYNPQAVLVIDAESLEQVTVVQIPVRFEIEGCAFHDGSLILSFITMSGSSLMRTDIVNGTVISKNGIDNSFHTSYNVGKWKGDGSEESPLVTVNPIMLLPNPYFSIVVHGLGNGELNIENKIVGINGATSSSVDTSKIYVVTRNCQVDYAKITISNNDNFDYAIYHDNSVTTIATSCAVNVTKSLFNIDHQSMISTGSTFTMSYGAQSRMTYSVFNGSSSNTGELKYTRSFINGVYGSN